MKKLISMLIIVALVLTIGATQVFAAETSRRNFVDQNQDGICDNQGQCQRNFWDDDHNGVCDNRAQNFVSNDNDGVCDNQPVCNNHGYGNCSQGRHHSNVHRRGCR